MADERVPRVEEAHRFLCHCSAMHLTLECANLRAAIEREKVKAVAPFAAMLEAQRDHEDSRHDDCLLCDTRDKMIRDWAAARKEADDE